MPSSAAEPELPSCLPQVPTPCWDGGIPLAAPGSPGCWARELLAGLCSPPTPASREEQPWAEVAEMETIEEETTMVEPKEGLTEPGSGPTALGDLQPLEPPGTPQERTLPSATGQPPDPAGVAEQPGPGVQPSLTEANPPPSPYLTPDFGKEDPFEILGKAMRYLPFPYPPDTLWSDSLVTPWHSMLPAPALGLSPAWWPLSSPFTVNRAKHIMSLPGLFWPH